MVISHEVNSDWLEKESGFWLSQDQQKDPKLEAVQAFCKIVLNECCAGALVLASLPLIQCIYICMQDKWLDLLCWFSPDSKSKQFLLCESQDEDPFSFALQGCSSQKKFFISNDSLISFVCIKFPLCCHTLLKLFYGAFWALLGLVCCQYAGNRISEIEFSRLIGGCFLTWAVHCFSLFDHSYLGILVAQKNRGSNYAAPGKGV